MHKVTRAFWGAFGAGYCAGGLTMAAICAYHVQTMKDGDLGFGTMIAIMVVLNVVTTFLAWVGYKAKMRRYFV